MKRMSQCLPQRLRQIKIVLYIHRRLQFLQAGDADLASAAFAQNSTVTHQTHAGEPYYQVAIMDVEQTSGLSFLIAEQLWAESIEINVPFAVA